MKHNHQAGGLLLPFVAVLEVMIAGKALSEPCRRDALKPPVRHLPMYQA